ncbi:hypothetical protein [Jiangella alkaliphila]|uniref:hypothetical protein n=1 Tax=Jiangella alkaliphila TaxID=419479 RepID=UPI0006298E9B|nr:hypothetical protein [Jiangella alkaliphila]
MRAARLSGADRQRAPDDVIIRNLGLAEAISRRYAGRGIDAEDLHQVASAASPSRRSARLRDLGAQLAGSSAPCCSIVEGAAARLKRTDGRFAPSMTA